MLKDIGHIPTASSMALAKILSGGFLLLVDIEPACG
jgi:hypothetical protein